MTSLFNFMCFPRMDIERRRFEDNIKFLFMLQGKLELVAKHSVLI